jgi:hypothetical protein
MVGLDNHPAAKAIPQSIPRNAHSRARPMSGSTRNGSRPARMANTSVPYSNFDIAAYLTEIILLGCVALRVGKKLEWDGPGMKANNAPEAARFVKREYRKELGYLKPARIQGVFFNASNCCRASG